MAQRPRRVPWWLWVGAPAAAVAVVVSLYALRQPSGVGGASELEAIPDAPGVLHVHGLGVNPADGDLYAATHSGVFHITTDGEAQRIANRHQDTMGFTIVGPDHFLASGHPDMREDLPPLLGLLESRDAAQTWTKKSLLGEADFHALRHIGDTIFGYDSTGSAFMFSRDGRRWETRSKTTLRDFVVDQDDPGIVFAAGNEGLRRSSDGGRTWTNIEGPVRPVLLDWNEPGQLWLVDMTGRIHFSADAGSTWEPRGTASGAPEAFHAADDVLYVAIAGSILTSEDGGRTWKVFYSEGVP